MPLLLFNKNPYENQTTKKDIGSTVTLGVIFILILQKSIVATCRYSFSKNLKSISESKCSRIISRKPGNFRFKNRGAVVSFLKSSVFENLRKNTLFLYRNNVFA